MKKLLSFVLLLFLNFTLQSQNLEWYATSQSTNYNYSNNGGLERDAAGNTYFTTESNGPSTFFMFYNSTVPQAHVYKLNAAGTQLWRNDLISSINCTPLGLTIDSSSNVYVIGHVAAADTVYMGAAYFVPNDTLDNSFICKMDSNGTLLFFKFFSGKFSYLHDIKVDAAQNIYVTGSYEKELMLDDTVLYSAVHDSFPFITYNRSFYVAKFDAMCNRTGVSIFECGLDGWNAGALNELALDPLANVVYAAGTFRDSLKINGQWMFSSGNSDIVLLKLAADCDVIWAKKDVSPAAGEMVNDLKVDPFGFVYMSGEYNSTVSFDTVTINPTDASYGDAFIVKYNDYGNALWAKTLGSVNYPCSGSKMATNKFGDVFWSGYYANNTTFGDTVLNVHGPLSYNLDTYVAKFSSDGNFKNVFEVNSSFQANPSEINLKEDTLLLEGFYRDTLFFGNTMLASQGTINNGDTYLMKFHVPLDASDDCIAHYGTTYDSIANTFFLTVDSVSFAYAQSYLWDFGDGTTSTLAMPSHTYPVDSVYNVCMKIYTASGDSCSYCNMIGIDSVGSIIRTGGFNINVQNITTGVGVSPSIEFNEVVYPNPSAGKFTVTAMNLKTIEIYNVLGEKIFESRVEDERAEIDLQKISKGIYFVKMVTENSFSTQTIIID